MHTVHMFKQCLIVLRFKDAHSSNYNIFQEESCLHQRVLFPKYGLLSWTKITLCIQKNDVQLWRTYFMCLHVPCVLHLRKYIVHSKGGVAESWVLSCWSFWFFALLLFWFLVFFVFWILVLFSHCRKTKQKLSMVAKQWENHRRCSGCKDVQCQWLQNAVKNRTPRVSPFCIYNPIPFSPFIPIVSHVSQLGASREDVEPPPGAASRFAILKKWWETHEKYEK